MIFGYAQVIVSLNKIVVSHYCLFVFMNFQQEKSCFPRVVSKYKMHLKTLCFPILFMLSLQCASYKTWYMRLLFPISSCSVNILNIICIQMHLTVESCWQLLSPCMLLQKPTLVYILTVYPKPKISMGKFFFSFHYPITTKLIYLIFELICMIYYWY